MPTSSQLILPPRPLASCIVGCIVRDTRAVQLSDANRMNYFPAQPLFTVTLTLHGQLHISDDILPLDALRKQPAAPRRLFRPPQTSPQMSWSTGPLHALTIAFYPDAWQRLGGHLDGTPPDGLHSALSLLENTELATGWPAFWRELSALWAHTTQTGLRADWSGSDKLKAWTNHLFGQLGRTGAGRSLRSAQRRLQRWTGMDRQTLEFFARIEDVHRLSLLEPTATPAQIAADAGFADQSHMGRALKRATGFSPVILNQKIATEEPFWCYRLLGQRF